MAVGRGHEGRDRGQLVAEVVGHEQRREPEVLDLAGLLGPRPPPCGRARWTTGRRSGTVGGGPSALTITRDRPPGTVDAPGDRRRPGRGRRSTTTFPLMSDPAASGPPSWMPAAVGSAYRHGVGTDDDLLSGRAWTDLLAALARAGAFMRVAPGPHRGRRPSLGLPPAPGALALGIDEALRPSTPTSPHIQSGQRRQRPQVGHGLSRRRLHRCRHPARRHLPRPGPPGHRPLSRLPGHGGHRQRRQRGGRRPRPRPPTGASSCILSAERHPGNWMAAARGGHLVRRPPVLLRLGHRGCRPSWRSSACTPAPTARRTRRPLAAAGVARQLRALGAFVRGQRRASGWTSRRAGGPRG